MHGINLAPVDKPLKCSGVDLENCCCLVAVQQGLTVESGPAIGGSYTDWWFSLIGHDASSLQANPYQLAYKRGSRRERQSSNDILSERHSFLE
jgi:hypothetical protein